MVLYTLKSKLAEQGAQDKGKSCATTPRSGALLSMQMPTVDALWTADHPFPSCLRLQDTGAATARPRNHHYSTPCISCPVAQFCCCALAGRCRGACGVPTARCFSARARPRRLKAPTNDAAPCSHRCFDVFIERRIAGPDHLRTPHSSSSTRTHTQFSDATDVPPVPGTTRTWP